MHNVRPVEMFAFDAASSVPLAIATQFLGNWVIQRFYGQYALYRSSELFDEHQRSVAERPRQSWKARSLLTKAGRHQRQ